MSIRNAAYAENLSSLMHADEALLVLGSLNANTQDRYLALARSEVKPVQLIEHSGIWSIPFFDSWENSVWAR
jgi:hypothetical protein